MSDTDEALIRHYYEEFFAAGKMAIVASFSELTPIELRDCFGSGDKIAARWAWSAKHTAEFMGIPATHRRITVKGIDIFRLADGQVVDHWQEMDILGLLRQISAPSPQGK
jgi:predicted ester cyclase